MRALTVGETIRVQDVPEPVRSGECTIRVVLAGICGTDLEILRGYAGVAGVPGHEFVGVVEDVPSEADAHWLGRRVVGEINVGCGRCSWCRTGIKEHCPERSVLGIKDRSGAFAEHLWLPAANLHAVPDELDDIAAVFVEPTAAACQILTQMDVSSDASVLVLGDGRMGLVVAQVLATTGAAVTVAGKHADKLEVARRIGLRTILATDASAPPDGFEVVVDVTGRPEGLTRALQLVKPRGTIVLKSTFQSESSATLWPAVVKEVRIVGSRCGPFKPAIALLASGTVQAAPLVSESFSLEDFEAAFEAARRTLKVLFRM